MENLVKKIRKNSRQRNPFKSSIIQASSKRSLSDNLARLPETFLGF